MFGFSTKSTLFVRLILLRSSGKNLNGRQFHFDIFVERIVIKRRRNNILNTSGARKWSLYGFGMTTKTNENSLVSGQEERDIDEVTVSEGTQKRKRESPQSRIDGHNKKKQRKRSERPGTGVEKYDETSYYFENGLRKVHPYFYTYTTFCKGRWVNRKLIDVFSQEFRALPAKEFARGIELGSITVNSTKVDIDYQLKGSDFIANTVHRHEIPVTAQPIKIVHLSEDFLVIDKPSSIPVHPCGRYRHNSVVFILGKEFKFRNLKGVHRLDRLTSGLLIFGRTPEKARELEIQIRSRQVQKEYLCRVEGEFPSEPMTCEEPIDVISFQIGICRVTPKGKSCKTIFERVSFNGRSSVVLCKPHTGRMHQIRVHLQFLGYPIVNDPLYNHCAFGPLKGKNGDTGKSDEELIAALIKAHNMEIWLKEETLSDDVVTLSSDSEKDNSIATSDSGEQHNCDKPPEVPVANDYITNNSKVVSDPNCLECSGQMVFKDPEPKDLIMYLHAWKYKGVDWNFETEKPVWTDDDWSDDT